MQGLTQVNEQFGGDPEDEGADILMMTGLHEELKWLQRIFGNEFKRLTRFGTSYLVCDIKRASRHVRIVALRQQEKGLTSSAITATKALCIWKPKMAVMTGICAGVKGSVNLGDLVVASQCFEHSSGQLWDGQFIPVQNRVSIPPWVLDFLMSVTDSEELQEQIQGGFGQMLPSESKPKIHYGAMACGPQVIKDQSYIELLRSKEHSLLAIDMESYGLALATSMCSTYSRTIVPLVVKGVCDFADSEKGDDWHDYCSYASAAFMHSVLDQAMNREKVYNWIKDTPING
jgi:nucleoside phosphorylase